MATVTFHFRGVKKFVRQIGEVLCCIEKETDDKVADLQEKIDALDVRVTTLEP